MEDSDNVTDNREKADLFKLRIGAMVFGVCFDGTYIWVVNNRSSDVARISPE